ncbi:hypothetical protein DFH09DRAFT_1491276 [Mycena vulgaris]|nr:hypothetical protein DFH09DRAFT_1491276 [Mycena vulgaris]
MPQTPNAIPSTPRTPLSHVDSREIYPTGYETPPKTPSYTPFALNNPGYPRQRVFTIGEEDHLVACPLWTKIAVKAVLYQLEQKFAAIKIREVLYVDSPFGRSERGYFISYYTIYSLGLDGELSGTSAGITSIFIIVYICPEMLGSPAFARILHAPAWWRRLSAEYIDKAHLIYQTHHWRPLLANLSVATHHR